MHLIEWPKSGTLTTLNAGKDMMQAELSLTAGGNAKCYRYFGKQFGVFFF